MCEDLVKIPYNLFINNPHVVNLSYCFWCCVSLAVDVEILSENVNNVENFAYETKTKGTVYVPADSLTYDTFINVERANVKAL